MPNWCENRLQVTGPQKDQDRFLEDVDGGINEVAGGMYKGERIFLTFEPLFPTPQELLDTKCPCTDEGLAAKHIEKYGFPDWYAWRIKNWGTKWDAVESKLIRVSPCLIYSFDTAWSPPIEWLRNISNHFPELIFTLDYEEVGMCFEGRCIIQNGHDLLDYYQDMSDARMKQKHPERFNDEEGKDNE